MATPVLSIEQQALAALRAGAVVVTSNQRAARHLRRAYDRVQQAEGRRAWPSAEVFAWTGWMKRLWQEHLLAATEAPAVLLDRGQEEALWRQAIAAQGNFAGQPYLEAAAATAARSWRTLHAYQLPLEHSSFRQRPDSAAFRAWAEEYLKRCRRNNWLDEARLPGALESALRAGTLPMPPRVFLAGFDELTPQQQSFMEAARARGTTVEQAAGGAPSAAVAVQARDVEEELAAAARWARGILEAASPQEPPPRIAVVVSSLDSLRGRAERAFLEALHPELLGEPAPGTRRAFELSAGPPLSEYPLVAAALAAVHLLAPGHALSQEDAGRLLLSPFFATEEEAGARARLEARLCRRGEVITLRALAGEAYRAPVLARRLDHAARYLRKLPATAAPSAWMKTVALLLRALGWPGERPQNSEEHQTVEKFKEVLDGFAALDLVLPSVSAAELPALLAAAAQATLFQPENEGAPIQVLGMLEAAGGEFDAMWVLGLHDEAWPLAASPDPLLPLGLQRERGAPGASQEAQVEAARRMLRRLRASAGEVVFSHPASDGDNELRASPLLGEEGIVPARLEEIAGEAGAAWAERLLAARASEQLQDDAAPPVEEGAQVRGGTGLFKKQAACPFRAFAEIRLGARALEGRSAGVDARDRGNIVHDALEHVWLELKDHAGLLRCQLEERSALVTRCVDAAIKEAHLEGTCGWEQRLAEMERERAIALVHDLLLLEERRAPFTVAAVEEKRVVSLGGLEVEVKADRVDRLPGGGLVILDYKTGNNESKANAWEGERPDEPQLPLYAATVEEEVAALAFVYARRGRVAFLGYAREGVLPEVKAVAAEDLNQSVAAWRQTLSALGEEFRAGRAEAAPIKQQQTCRNCHLPALCRIFEVRPVRGEDDAEPEEGDDA